MLIKCTKCGKMISSERTSGLCSTCNVEDSQDTFNLVRSFVYDHPRVPIEVVSEETGVSVKLIKQYVKEGRLELVTEVTYNCLECGESISSGKLCMKCSEKVKKSLTKSNDTNNNNIKKGGIEFHTK